MWWFRPTCPLAADRKAWIEYRMSWLAAEIGPHRFSTGPVILPTEEFFPDPYDGSEEAIRALLDRVCGYMDIDPAAVALDLYSQKQYTDLGPGFQVVREGPTSAGLYYENSEKAIVAIEENHRDDPLSLVATMAHELGHVYLLGGGRVSRDEPDQEQLTDLTTVCFGLGILAANAVIRESRWSGGGWSGWGVGRHGYLTENDFAYALAVYAFARSETRPSWASRLRLNVRSMLKQSLRYISKTGDCHFNPGKPIPPATMPVWGNTRQEGGVDPIGL